MAVAPRPSAARAMLVRKETAAWLLPIEYGRVCASEKDREQGFREGFEGFRGLSSNTCLLGRVGVGPGFGPTRCSE